MMKKIILLHLISFLFLSCQKNVSTTPYEYALLSAHVYDDKDISDLPNHFEPFLDFDEDDYSNPINLNLRKMKEMKDKKEWGKLIPYVAFKAFSRGGYFGRAYLNQKNNQVIIAHRGTDINIKLDELTLDEISIAIEDGNLWNALKDMDDDYDIMQGKIPAQQFGAAEYFVDNVRATYLAKYNREPTIIHTGHSLGAILAELCAVTNGAKAVTFESPGSKPMLPQLTDYQKLDLQNLDITVYNAEPNPINTLHEHAGEVIPLYDKKDEQNLYENLENGNSLKQHSIEELLKRFDKKTGNPK